MSNYLLPEYPCTRDMWDELAEEKRPILIYGMGNGADKLLSRFEKYGIVASEVFASDGFVRGHSYRGFKVKSFSEVCEQYDDFVIVLSFGTNREEVLNMLVDIDGRYDLYAPDMPIANEEEYFDREFYNAHYSEILSAYESLFDERSKNVFSLILRYKISGRIKFLEQSSDADNDIYSLFDNLSIGSVIDGGAYNGDTLKEMREHFPMLAKAIAVEPDARTFKKLSSYADSVDDFDLELHRAALWSSDGVGVISSSANRNSTVTATASYEHRAEQTELVTVDFIAKDQVDYIKYDLEGAEREALAGSIETIKKYSPALRIAIYHRSCDIFTIINYMKEKTYGYEFYIRRKRCLPAWEIDLIMIPRRNCNDK